MISLISNKFGWNGIQTTRKLRNFHTNTENTELFHKHVQSHSSRTQKYSPILRSRRKKTSIFILLSFEISLNTKLTFQKNNKFQFYLQSHITLTNEISFFFRVNLSQWDGNGTKTKNIDFSLKLKSSLFFN